MDPPDPTFLTTGYKPKFVQIQFCQDIPLQIAHLCIYLFMVYCTIILRGYARGPLRRMLLWLLSDKLEGMWKWSWPNLRRCSDGC